MLSVYINANFFIVSFVQNTKKIIQIFYLKAAVKIRVIRDFSWVRKLSKELGLFKRSMSVKSFFINLKIQNFYITSAYTFGKNLNRKVSVTFAQIALHTSYQNK